LTGQVVYALTRYDRQDISFQITEALARRCEEYGMIGALPSIIGPESDEPANTPSRAGAEASTAGMADFVRTFYQDYLGLRIDVPSNQLYLQPKLPDRITDVDFTVYFGADPVNGRMERERDISRIILTAPTIQRPVRVGFIWMLESGDAWRGSTTLTPDTTLTVAIGRDDVLAYHGDRKATLASLTKLKGFSLRNAFTGFDLAMFPKR